MDNSKYYCRVCGLNMDESPWGEDGHTPNYEICPCCGCEFGNDDYTLDSVKRYRGTWLENGAKWFNIKKKPINWDIEKQLLNVPKDYL
jgi:hypothetical protein